MGWEADTTDVCQLGFELLFVDGHGHSTYSTFWLSMLFPIGSPERFGQSGHSGRTVVQLFF